MQGSRISDRAKFRGWSQPFLAVGAGFALVTMGGCALDRTPPAPLASVRSSIAEELEKAAIPSVAVARTERGRVAWTSAWGEQSPGVRATDQTLYNVASLAKPISAETVLRAAAAGRLSIDEPLHGWWVDPDLANDPRHRSLTPRLALTHRTGFPNWRSETGDRLTFKNEPGGAVGYSGEGFEYLARYAERRTATPFERLAETLVFRPSGMRSTSYTRRDWFTGRVAVPTDADGRALAPSIRERFLASDDLYTTAGDYGRFLASVANRQGLNRAVADERERIQVSTLAQPCPLGPACPDAAGWGLGWDVAVFGADRVLWHTGADRGEFTFAYIVPRTGEGAVILTNSARGYMMVLPVLERIGAHPRFTAYLRAQAN